jgi:hypothetical protein
MNTQSSIPAPIAEHEIIEPSSPMDMETSLAIGLSRAEIDQQIATARRYPRSIKQAVNNILTLATLDEGTAEECIYSLPRGGKAIEGASIRLAEIIAQSWGNCRIATRVVHVDKAEKYIEAEGVYHDLETNMATLARVRRRISDKSGKVYNDDMIQQTGNAAASIARRNAILAGVPKGVWWKGYEAARQVVMGDAQTLTNRRADALKAFHRFGVVPEMVYGALNVKGEEDISLDHIVTMRGMFSGLENGEATVEEMFDTRSSAKQKVTANEALNNFAGETNQKNEAPQSDQHKPEPTPSNIVSEEEGAIVDEKHIAYSNPGVDAPTNNTEVLNENTQASTESDDPDLGAIAATQNALKELAINTTAPAIINWFDTSYIETAKRMKLTDAQINIVTDHKNARVNALAK